MATKLKFPFMTHCQRCKAELKVKKQEQVHTIISCPKCGKKTELVPPEEDGMVAYGVEAPRVEKVTEEEDEEAKELIWEKLEQERKDRKRKFIWWSIELTFLLMVLAGTGFGYWYFVVRGYNERMEAREKNKGNDPDLFGQTFKID